MAADEAKYDGTFKVPLKPVPKTKGKKVLGEEEFIIEMEKIIEADFFPDLKSLRFKMEYLEAMDLGDYSGMRQAYIKLKRHREGRKGSLPSPSLSPSPSVSSSFGDTPSTVSDFDMKEVALGFGNDTPGATPVLDKISSDQPLQVVLMQEKADEAQRKWRRHGLDAFLQEHTSEDNESFRILMEKTEAERRRKKAWMYDPPSKPGETSKQDRLALPSIEEQADQTNRPANMDSDVCPVYNSVMFVPEGKELTMEEKLANQKPVIKHGSTRLMTNPFPTVEKSEKDTSVVYKRSAGKGEKIGVDGKLENEGKAEDLSAKFNFVSTPKIRPDDVDSPLLTWGEVIGTPILLEGPSHAGTPSFRMAPTPKRDMLAEKLVQKSKASSRSATPVVQSQHSRASPFGDHKSRRLGSMSPAAHLLMTRKLGITPTLRSGRTPSPIVLTPRKRTPGSDRTPRKDSTPVITRASIGVKTPQRGSTCSGENLLKLPKN
ncbi:unnamed protein product [Notodromas monacha]|uniref:DGCR14 n=1 Tax=Notodromas monacha TaxID=399045 RepID=A0A7R9GAT5_9CRUS|nr:unnamed protein product [Notodromas monacha]CAG0914078.1 unnamed protein product [Notodromas monacha]